MFARDDLLHYIRRQQQRLERSLGQAASTGEVEAVHGLRVASRRANEALKLAARWLDRGQLKSLGQRLRRLRNAFREVRDYDVLLRSFGEAATAPKLASTDLAQLEGLLTSARQRAWWQVVHDLRRKDGKRILRTFDEVRKSIDSAAPGRDGLLRKPLRKRWRQRVRGLLAQPPNADAGEELHPLRLGVKKLRYCTELWESLAGEDRADIVKVCTGMQDRLGAWHDHLQAVELLAGLAGGVDMTARQPAWAAAVLTYAASRARMAETSRHEIIAAWPALADELERHFRSFGKAASAANAPDREPQGASSRGET